MVSDVIGDSGSNGFSDGIVADYHFGDEMTWCLNRRHQISVSQPLPHPHLPFLPRNRG